MIKKISSMINTLIVNVQAQPFLFNNKMPGNEYKIPVTSIMISGKKHVDANCESGIFVHHIKKPDAATIVPIMPTVSIHHAAKFVFIGSLALVIFVLLRLPVAYHFKVVLSVNDYETERYK